MLGLLKLSGIKPKLDFKITEITMNSANKVVSHYLSNGEIDRMDKLHEIMKVTLSDGNDYALDLAGAQYGQHRPAMHLSTYEEEYADEYNVIWKDFINKAEVADLSGGPKVSYIGKSVMARLAVETTEWEKDNKITVAALLNEKQAMFEAKKDDLVGWLSNEMFEHVEAMIYTGLVCIGAP